MNPQNNNPSPAAVLPRRSRRLATIIPASHWISIGYSQADANAMEKLQSDMKKYCDGGGDTNVKIELASSGPLPYHDMMLPHWKKLAKKLNSCTSVEDFDITLVSTPPQVLESMFPSLLTNLKNMLLVDTGLGNDGYVCLSSFLGENTSLRCLGIGLMSIGNLSVATSFSNAIYNHPTMNKFILANCLLENNTAILTKILDGCGRLEDLGLSMNNLGGSEAIAVLADFISSNHPLKVIHLHQNNISDDDTVLFAAALKNNKNLKRLSLMENDGITEEGDKNLMSALFDPTSMDSIVESNHTCIPVTYNIHDDDLRAQRMTLLHRDIILANIGTPSSIQKKIRKKVVLALCCGQDFEEEEPFDIAHLNDLPLQLMPRVLELIQEHPAISIIQLNENKLKKDALSRLFHTLRAWELPLLFGNLHAPSSGAGTKRKRRKTRR